jgi:hypothetical protein
LKRFLALFLCLAALCVSAQSRTQVSVTATLSASDTGACTTANACLYMYLASNSGASAIQITGTWSATAQFEAATSPGGTFGVITAIPIGGGSSVTSSTANGNWQLAVSGQNTVRVRLSAYTSGSAVVVITQSPANVNVSAAGQASSPNQNGIYLSPNCGSQSNCFQAYFDVQYAYSVSCTSTSQTITTGSGDPPFTAADVGKLIYGVSAASLNSAANCPPQGTITGFTDAHHVTVSVAATGSSSALGTIAWGHNDGTQIAAAFQASLGVGCLGLPNGAAFFAVPPFADARSTATGPADCVKGTGQTVLTPLTTFNYSGCQASQWCIFVHPAAPDQQPNYATLENFEIYGLTATLTGTGSSDYLFKVQFTNLYNVWVWGWGSGVASPYYFSGPVNAGYFISDSSGAIGCDVNGTGGNAAVQFFGAWYCGETVKSLQIENGATLDSVGGQIGPASFSGSTIANVVAGGIWNSKNEVILNPSTNEFTTVSGTASFDGDEIDGELRALAGTTTLRNSHTIGVAANTFGGVDCAVSGAKIHIQTTLMDGGGTSGVSLRSVSGCDVFNDGGNSFANVNNSLSGNGFALPAEAGTITCSGSAATITFKLVYQGAPNYLIQDQTTTALPVTQTSESSTALVLGCPGASDVLLYQITPAPF